MAHLHEDDALLFPRVDFGNCKRIACFGFLDLDGERLPRCGDETWKQFYLVKTIHLIIWFTSSCLKGFPDVGEHF